MSTPTIEQRPLRLFLLVGSGFVLALSIALWTTGAFSLRTYFMISFVLFLISSEIFAPRDPTVSWWTRLQWVKMGGWIILAYLLFERVSTFLL